MENTKINLFFKEISKKNKNYKKMEKILKNINLNYQDESEKNLLMIILEITKDETIIKMLLKENININHIDKNFNNIMYYIMKNKINLNIIKILVKKNINLNQANYFGYTTLMLALIYNKDYEVIKFLLEKGCNINKKNYNKDNCLQIALYNFNKFEIIDLLMRKNADIFNKNKQMRNSFLILVNKNYSLKFINLFISYNILNLNENDDFEILFIFFQKNKFIKLKILLNNLKTKGFLYKLCILNDRKNFLLFLIREFGIFYNKRFKINFLILLYLFDKDNLHKFLKENIKKCIEIKCFFGWNSLQYKKWLKKKYSLEYYKLFYFK